MRTSQIHASLNRRKAIMGVPLPIFAMEALAVIFIMSGGMYIFIPLVLPIHFAARWMHTRDDGAFKALFNYQSESDVYDPWARPSTTNKRPRGYGKGLQC
jgi:type IV secretory pathway VirB3-like protein